MHSRENKIQRKNVTLAIVVTTEIGTQNVLMRNRLQLCFQYLKFHKNWTNLL